MLKSSKRFLLEIASISTSKRVIYSTSIVKIVEIWMWIEDLT